MRRLLLAALAALTLLGLLAAAAPAVSAGPAGAAGGGSIWAMTGTAAPAALAKQPAARPSSVCQGDGTGCTKAGSYPNLNAVINSDYNGFKVVWTSSVVQQYSSGVPLYWTANVTYTNVTSSTLTLGCPGSWTNPSSIWEWMAGGSGDDGGVAASSTLCSSDPSLSAAIPPGGSVVSHATFHNVPWPGSTVSLQWGDAGSSAAVHPFAAPSPVPPCTINPLLQCQSLNPAVALDINYWGDTSACVFTWNVNWGDGTVDQNLVVADPPDGEVFLIGHTYQAQLTYTIAVTGSQTGDCTVSPFTATFTLLAYAALGDSYSAGVGAGDFIDIGGPGALCYESYEAYPLAVAGDLGDTAIGSGDLSIDDGQFQFSACNGAVIRDFTGRQEVQAKPSETVPPQLDVLQEATGNVGLVTFTISGNDADFADVMTYCAWRTDKEKSCRAEKGGTVAADLKKIKSELPVLFARIKKMKGLAAGARVLVLGYPWFFDPAWFQPNAQPPVCGTGIPFRTFLNSDMKWIDDSIGSLDSELTIAARAAGFGYVNDLQAFAGGHYLCEQHPYLNSATLPVFESYHPNAEGEGVMAADVAKVLGLS